MAEYRYSSSQDGHQGNKTQWSILGAPPEDGMIINSLWPSDATWSHKSWLTLVQVMACHLCGTRPLPEPMTTRINDTIIALLGQNGLTQWGRVTHICVSKLTIIGSDNGLSTGRRQAIIWTNAGILSIQTNITNKLQWNLKRNAHVFIQENAFENVFSEMAAIWSRPQCVKSSNTIASILANGSTAFKIWKLSFC